MPIDFKKLYAQKKAAENRVLRHFPDITDDSGIYIIKRYDKEKGMQVCYIGKAKHILSRLADHLLGYKQHIDKSLRKHGLYSESNKNGYTMSVVEYCPLCMLDEKERKLITDVSKIKSILLYNVESGGTIGKTDINERQPNLKYHEGYKRGYDRCLKDIRVYFEKYLEPTIKGKTNKIKERKLIEFTKLLIGEEEQ